MREGGRRDSASRVKEDQQNLAECLGTPNFRFVGLPSRTATARNIYPAKSAEGTSFPLLLWQ